MLSLPWFGIAGEDYSVDPSCILNDIESDMTTITSKSEEIKRYLYILRDIIGKPHCPTVTVDVCNNSQQNPASSCQQLAHDCPQLDSGYYWVRNGIGQPTKGLL